MEGFVHIVSTLFVVTIYKELCCKRFLDYIEDCIEDYISDHTGCDYECERINYCWNHVLSDP